VIRLDTKVPASTFATGTAAPPNAPDFDDFAALHARLAVAMFETFFRQLALIHTCMTTFPAAWPRLDAETPMPDVKAGPFVAQAADVAFAANVAGPEVLQARRTVRKIKAAGKKILP
jgi:hypothetical protein